MSIDALAEILGLPNFLDILFEIGESERGAYTIETSGDVAYDVKEITIRFHNRGTNFGAGVTWIITSPKEGDYKFRVSGGATLYVARYSHNSPRINQIRPTSIIGKAERSASVTTVTKVYYENKKREGYSQ
ncbi:hypothetical protein PNA2_1101 [Pyrococcus sp. NA2]|uniref:hypothetical protein n=1 Tax=Pyrococcus sp. (strain NA2) TaxID=342949 RepID=UPI000209AAEF|nr:hypothetical protein [Pyrococcus sp. NA2]AEC52017.1 hypothetical protein PNA2_1101 [Pyrococcus sp. NA2]